VAATPEEADNLGPAKLVEMFESFKTSRPLLLGTTHTYAPYVLGKSATSNAVCREAISTIHPTIKPVALQRLPWSRSMLDELC